MRNTTAAIAIAIAIGAAPLATAFAELTGDARVIDGDTIELGGEDVRLHGIDAPESDQSCRAGGGKYPCGKHATQALEAKIANNEVRCTERERDQYGRVIGVCYVRGDNLNAFMVKTGWARAYRRYSRDYVGAERSARQTERGIWSGAFVNPWDYRDGKRLGGR